MWVQTAGRRAPYLQVGARPAWGPLCAGSRKARSRAVGAGAPHPRAAGAAAAWVGGHSAGWDPLGSHLTLPPERGREVSREGYTRLRALPSASPQAWPFTPQPGWALSGGMKQLLPVHGSSLGLGHAGWARQVEHPGFPQLGQALGRLGNRVAPASRSLQRGPGGSTGCPPVGGLLRHVTGDPCNPGPPDGMAVVACVQVPSHDGAHLGKSLQPCSPAAACLLAAPGAAYCSKAMFLQPCGTPLPVLAWAVTRGGSPRASPICTTSP